MEIHFRSTSSTNFSILKIMLSQVFSVSRFILGMPTLREPYSPLHQGEEQSDTGLFLRGSGPFFLYYAIRWIGRGKKENCGWRKGGEVEEIGQSSITGRMVFHILFML